MEGKTVVSVVAVGCFCLLFLIREVFVLFGGVAIWYTRSWVKFLGRFLPLWCLLLFSYPVLHHLRWFFYTVKLVSYSSTIKMTHGPI